MTVVLSSRGQSEQPSWGNTRPYLEGTIRILLALSISRQHSERNSLAQKEEWSETTMEPITQAAQVRSYSSSRRSQIRYPLRTPVIYRWLDNNGSQRRAKGWTRDISEGGAYILSSQCPQKGELVELKFRLLVLREQRTPRRNEHLEMGGEVVRVDAAEVAGEAVGFAVRSKTAIAAKQTDEVSQRPWISNLAMRAICN